MQNSRMQYSGGPHSLGDDYSTKVCSKRGSREDEGGWPQAYKKKFSWLAEVYWKKNVVWPPGYFVSTVRIGEREILKYVKWQQSQDSGQVKLGLF